MKTTAIFAIITACPQVFGSFFQSSQSCRNDRLACSDWSVKRASYASMGDFFGDSSLIIVQKAAPSDVRVGMMVVYRSPEGELISHKVIAHNGSQLRTTGVANWSVDPEPVTEDMLIGAVFAVFYTSGGPTGLAFASNGSTFPTLFAKLSSLSIGVCG